jgi:uncharacterized membrane protein
MAHFFALAVVRQMRNGSGLPPGPGGRERTFEQDPRYPICLLVDVAIKALSPAINDPTTAVQTIDQIEDLLRRLGGSQLSSGVINGADGIVRLALPMRHGTTI